MSKEYTEKEKREAIIDCAGSFHPAVGGKYLSWNPWLHIRKTYTDEIDRLERELAETERMVKHLAEIVTDLRLERDEAIQADTAHREIARLQLERVSGELAEARVTISQQHTIIEGMGELQLDNIFIKLQRDRLAEALEACLPFLPGDACGEYSDAKEDLAAVKGDVPS